MTDVPELAERVRLLRAHGEQPRYHHRLVGTTARLDALQAAVLRPKLARLEAWNEERRRLGAMLATLIGDGLVGHDGAIEIAARSPSMATTSTTCSSSAASTRDALRDHLSQLGHRFGDPLPDSDPSDRGLRGSRSRRPGACRSVSDWLSESARCRCIRR